MNPIIEKQVIKHGNDLNRIFNTGIDPVKLCRALRRIEAKAGQLALAYCNGDIDDITDTQKEEILKAVDKLLNFYKAGIAVVFNLDPRGYALKIDDEEMRTKNLVLYRDWGGYGIIAPEFTKQ